MQPLRRLGQARPRGASPAGASPPPAALHSRSPQSLAPSVQASTLSSVPMSRLEPDAFVDYDTMADKLKARGAGCGRG